MRIFVGVWVVCVRNQKPIHPDSSVCARLLNTHLEFAFISTFSRKKNNHFLIALSFSPHCVRRQIGANQNSKSATIEMYAPSSYNDTVTGETLSSVSEKSDSYSNDGSQPDYMVSSRFSSSHFALIECAFQFWMLPFHSLIFASQDDTRKKAASTYLVENTDMPPPRYQKDGTLPINYPNNVPNSG